MSNIYVDELPKSCDWCPCCHYDDYNGVNRCEADIKRPFKPIIDWGVDKLSTCPLKLIADRLSEERKKVVQEIKSCINDRIQNESCFITRDENGKPITTMATICSNYTINELSYLIKFLDKVEGENNGRDRTNKI